MKPKVLILKGGNSIEREISLKSFDNFIKYIDNNKYNIKDLDIKEPNFFSLKAIEEENPDIVFNLIHGGFGEDGTLQNFLSMLDIKYVGSKSLSSALCMDKNLSKTILKANNIPIADYIYIKKESNLEEYINEIEQLEYPVIVKPNCGGASIGLEIAENENKLREAIEKIKKLRQDIIIEKFIDGQEVVCTVIQTEEGVNIMPILDINITEGIYDFEAKYKLDTDIRFSKFPKFLKNMIKEIAKKSFEVLKCEGYANIDFIVKDEQIYVLEVNTVPGFTDKSILPRGLRLSDIKISDFIDYLINFSLS